MSDALRIAVIAGEESGELLAADLIETVAARTGRSVELIGVGGHRLEALGLRSLFPSHEIALMGVSAVIRDLPRLIRRIGSTAKAIAEAKPNCLITVDSPDFTLRVARKVRTLAPSIPVVHYVCPSVWAWRPGRAPAMKPYVDHVLCLLPFEPAELKRLGGPPGTFVGHRLATDPGVLGAAAAQAQRTPGDPDAPKTLLVLPGSRRGEVKSLLEPFAETVEILMARGNKLNLVTPTVPHVAELVRAATAEWPVRPQVVTDPAEKWRAFGMADAALCASGTVSLELALSGVPMACCYKLDGLARFATGLVKAWSIVLPNLIADKPIVTEYIGFTVRPSYIARQLEALMNATPLRQWQVSGFEDVRRAMRTERPSGELAADVVLAAIRP